MSTAWLLAGDRDFVPVVESLVRLGTYVRVVCHPRRTSGRLTEVADGVVSLGLHDLWDWSDAAFKGRCPLPSRRLVGGSPDFAPRRVMRRGLINNDSAVIYDAHGGAYTLAVYREPHTEAYDSHDLRWLLNAAKYEHGDRVQWNSWEISPNVPID